ncbi:Transcriptional regulator, LysR family [Caballeronia glathei]|jgi:DNA-binding transcriptional LysR family regulator|uniref:LysR family transcriptional regulator n=1 Tax=Caballeronia glathei TaxID=60547 RepID=A0A069PTW7_9BURK|nr:MULTISPECIES: LysR family transcriptional regulator [Burkholderiaceae]KDR43279.1 LysR family transcriptional regulator [Caballeronia glathei]TCK39503.1 LysR family transcriptional regulator [Paraburkholderia sp. BL8N3]CDY75183.1 Transcriptional regulator, LysR family [Caballeronia glathei]
MLPNVDSIAARLRLKQLRLLIALDDHGSLHRAADEMSLTQPGATKALREIESTFGETLFVRSAQGIRPNELGRCVIRYARLIHMDVAHLREEMAGILQGSGGRLAVGAIMGAVSGVLVDALTRLRAKQPALTVEVVEDTSARLLALLDQGRLDLAICRASVARQPEHYDYLELRDEPLAIVAGMAHALIDAPEVTLADLALSRWIVYPSIMPLRGLFEREFKEAGLPLPLHPVETASTITTVLLLQRDPTLVSLMPLDMAAFLTRHGLAKRLAIAVRSRTEPYGIVTRRGAALSAATKLMIDELTQ